MKVNVLPTGIDMHAWNGVTHVVYRTTDDGAQCCLVMGHVSRRSMKMDASDSVEVTANDTLIIVFKRSTTK